MMPISLPIHPSLSEDERQYRSLPLDHINIMYKDPLYQCNYGCEYCHREWEYTRENIEYATNCLNKLVDWIEQQKFTVSLFLVPTGESVNRAWVKKGFTKLLDMKHVKSLITMTNLSFNIEWLKHVDASKLYLWCTFHPTEVSNKKFLQQVHKLKETGANFSVGSVAVPDNYERIRQMRDALPDDIYMWMTPQIFERHTIPYREHQYKQFKDIDPLFDHWFAQESNGKACRMGHSVIRIDSDGCVLHCPIIRQPLLFDNGTAPNIYEPGWEKCLYKRPCPRNTCPCDIGLLHIEDSVLSNLFAFRGKVPLERFW